MTQAQADAERCGLVPEESSPWFVAQHLSAYAFMRPRVAGRKVLEVGFGDGYGAAYLAESAAEVVGVDIVAGNIPVARAKYPNLKLKFEHFDGAHIPFPDSTFDAAGSFQVIEHVPEPQIIPWLAEIQRVLKPGGRFYVSTLNLEHNQKPGKPYQKLVYHEKEFTATELEAVLKKVFEKVSLHGLHLTLKQRFFRRLKKWGVRMGSYYDSITVRDFTTSQQNIRKSLDLIAVCEKTAFHI